jgi:NAD(P)-dependent dehydrogenase (short-subunit alcohol dehydrogenase family)
MMSSTAFVRRVVFVVSFACSMVSPPMGTLDWSSREAGTGEESGRELILGTSAANQRRVRDARFWLRAGARRRVRNGNGGDAQRRCSSLCGRVALITGATSGVGRAIARALAREGARVAVVGREDGSLRSATTDIARQSPQEIRRYRADLTVDADVRALASRVVDDFGTLDVLVHSAGVIGRGSIDTAIVDEFDWQYRTNVRAPYLLTQLLLPRLRDQRGHVVFLNSTAALRVPALSGQYAATKLALKAFADSLRDEVNGDGIRVLTLFLGSTASPMQSALHQLAGKSYRPERLIQPDDLAALLLHVLKLPDSAEVTDLVVRPMRTPLDA